MGKLVDTTKGKIKQAVGEITDNPKLRREGQRDELVGNVKGAIADVKKAAKDTGKAIKDAVRK